MRIAVAEPPLDNVTVNGLIRAEIRPEKALGTTVALRFTAPAKPFWLAI